MRRLLATLVVAALLVVPLPAAASATAQAAPKAPCPSLSYVPLVSLFFPGDEDPETPEKGCDPTRSEYPPLYATPPNRPEDPLSVSPAGASQ
jgi:hypothetical protein